MEKLKITQYQIGNQIVKVKKIKKHLIDNDSNSIHFSL